jgi:hypothetical protein
MARPGRPERNRAARSFRQLGRFHHVINSNKVFGTHNGRFPEGAGVIIPAKEGGELVCESQVTGLKVVTSMRTTKPNPHTERTGYVWAANGVNGWFCVFDRSKWDKIGTLAHIKG